jgi:F420-non-reducing hydrogenase large subunit
MYAAERANQLINDPEIIPKSGLFLRKYPSEGGIVEAPRGTLTHHYVTDEKGIVKMVNLVVGT